MLNLKMWKFYCFMNFVILFSILKCQNIENSCFLRNEKSGDASNWKLVWQDNFESEQIDSQKWTVADQLDDSQFCDCKSFFGIQKIWILVFLTFNDNLIRFWQNFNF